MLYVALLVFFPASDPKQDELYAGSLHAGITFIIMFGVYALGSIFITMFGSTRWYQLSMPPPHHRSSHSLATCGMCDRKIGTLQTPSVPYGRMVGTFVACEDCADSACKRAFECGTSQWLAAFESEMRNRSEDTQPNTGTL